MIHNAMKRILLYFAFMLPMSAIAQNVVTDTLKNTFGITARVMDDRIIVRWAPSSFSAWILANKTGYLLERAESDIFPGDVSYSRDLEFKPVPGFPRWPYTLEEWKAKTDTTNAMVANAAQALLRPSADEGSTGMDLIYKLNSQQITRHALAMLAADMNAEAATGLALRYEDTDLKSGRYYVYRISNLPPSKKGIVTDTAFVTVQTGKSQEPIAVQGISIVNGHNQVEVNWNLKLNSAFFTGYHVERSEKGMPFQRLTALPIVCSQGEEESADCTYLDTMVVNFNKYEYRIVGIDPFAMESLPSKPMAAEPYDQVGPPPAFNIAIEDISEGFEITWEGDHSSADHGGWYVGRSLQASGPFAILHEKPLSKETRRFIDRDPVPLVTNYYAIYAVDTYGNRNISGANAGIRSDSIPPAKPTNLNGVIDSNGMVTLYWDMGKELDLMAYRVFRATSADRKFFQVTTAEGLAPTNVYIDQVPLNTLSEEVYYTIVALDFHYNPSVYSDILTLKIPDTIPPAKPLFTAYSMTDKGVVLQWVSSSSDDVVMHRIWRQSDNNWVVIHTLDDPGTTTWTDEGIAWNTDYTYALEAIDDAGLSSGRSEALEIKTPVRPPVAGITDITGQFDSDSKTYKIEWRYAGQEPVKFLVYRGKDNEPLEWYGEAAPSEREFIDARFYKTEIGYSYAVSALFADGTSTPIDKPFVVTIQR